MGLRRELSGKEVRRAAKRALNLMANGWAVWPAPDGRLFLSPPRRGRAGEAVHVDVALFLLRRGWLYRGERGLRRSKLTRAEARREAARRAASDKFTEEVAREGRLPRAA